MAAPISRRQAIMGGSALVAGYVLTTPAAGMANPSTTNIETETTGVEIKRAGTQPSRQL